MRRMTAIIMAVMFIFGMSACGGRTADNENQQGNAQEIYITVTNTVEEHVAGLGVSWCIEDEVLGSTEVKAADNDMIGNGAFEFVFYSDELPENTDLEKFGVKFNVSEKSGVSFNVATLNFPVEFGKIYEFELREQDGCYAIWSVTDQVLYSGNSISVEAETNAE